MTPRIHNHAASPLRSRARRAIAALAGLSALAVAAPSLAAPKSRVAFFTDDGKGQPGQLLSDFTCPTGDSHGQNQGELSSLVTQTPLQEIIVSYVGGTMTTEADVFALDPHLESLLLRVQALSGVTYDHYGNDWEKLTRRPSDNNDVTLPYAVVVPYPNEDVLFLPPPGSPPLDAQVHLDPTKFAGGPPHSLAGNAADPPLGAVKGLRVYDHGWCSHPADLQPIYDTIQDQIWEGFESYAHDNGADAKRFYTAIVTMLDREDKAPTDELHGGFQLSGHLAAYPPWPAPDVDASGVMEAEFVLQKGHLRAVYTEKPFVYPVIAANPWVSDQDVIDQVTGMFDEVKNGVGQEADDAQTINVSGDKAKCNPLEEDPCHDQRFTFGGQVNLAAALVNNDFQVSIDTFALQQSVMDQDLWSCVQTKPPQPHTDDCDPDVDPQCIHDKPGDHSDPTDPPPEPAQYECRFFVPAKRLNVYPDQVELVWFDGLEESNNPAVGVYAAAYATGDKDAQNALCSPRPDGYSVDFRQREYARGFGSVLNSPAP